jgi:site-specific DNA-methyltransferase (adenine-specific)
MKPKEFLGGKIILHEGDCRSILKTLPDNSVDSVVTDPPYHLHSGNVSTDWSAFKTKKGITNKSGRGHKTGFMNKAWDGGDIAFQPELWAEVLRVLKPGGYIMAFSGCRTYHHMACAIEDAGFITHQMFAWCFGSGFPKSHSVRPLFSGAEATGGQEDRYTEFFADEKLPRAPDWPEVVKP